MIPMRIIPPPASVSAPPSSPPSARSACRRILQGPVRDGARARRGHHQGELPHPEEGGLPEIPQPGVALRPGRVLRRQAAVGSPRRRDRGRVPPACSGFPNQVAIRSALPKSLEGLSIPARMVRHRRTAEIACIVGVGEGAPSPPRWKSPCSSLLCAPPPFPSTVRIGRP